MQAHGNKGSDCLFEESGIDMCVESNLSFDLVEKLHFNKPVVDAESSDDETECGQEDPGELTNRLNQLREYSVCLVFYILKLLVISTFRI
jgi:hypothetical protein